MAKPAKCMSLIRHWLRVPWRWVHDMREMGVSFGDSAVLTLHGRHFHAPANLAEKRREGEKRRWAFSGRPETASGLLIIYLRLPVIGWTAHIKCNVARYIRFDPLPGPAQAWRQMAILQVGALFDCP